MTHEMSRPKMWFMRIWLYLPSVFLLGFAAVLLYIKSQYWIAVPLFLALSAGNLYLLSWADRRRPLDDQSAKLILSKATESMKTSIQIAVVAVPLAMVGRIDPSFKYFALGLVSSPVLGAGWTRSMDEIGNWYIERKGKSS